MLRRIKTTRNPFKSPAGGKAVIVITGKAPGRLSVRETWQLPASRTALAETAMQAASQPHGGAGEPLDAALAAFAQGKGVGAPSHPPLRSLPFDHTAGMSGHLWHNGGEYTLAVKGAPEHVLARCDLTENERERAHVQLHKLAGKGYHVIALARRTLARPVTAISDLTKKDALEFVGLIALADAPLAAIPAALPEDATVYFITGDHPETAYHHGRELGLVRSRGQVFDARRLDVTDDQELEKIIGRTRVFARATPGHKQRIVKFLEKRGVVVASSLEKLRNR